ncbi:uncharacterized protein [Phyllobates terribilis]|uniref:uncharacterized protein n=1 Tax=Phyllobates terribilis TaxID=111132 RepID=UPI003CCB326C
MKGNRVDNTYLFDHYFVPSKHLCLATLEEQSNMWHQRLGHASLHLLHKLQARGLPDIKLDTMTHCSECTRAKITRKSLAPPKKSVTTKRPLELLHMDLCGPIRLQST